ncbi:hypothetical protein BT93_B1643 [Corymbia citriodora subsp. variegata]|nr:hypothetical protein BT93_B1643 [Corymbia citriodora subsp. variegata]
MAIVAQQSGWLPKFDFPTTEAVSSEAVVVGKWYCPFMLVKGWIGDQVSRSLYHKMALRRRQKWIYTGKNTRSEGKSVATEVAQRSKVILVAGKEAMDSASVVDGMTWFRTVGDPGREKKGGLSLAFVERMKWEERVE